MEIIKLLALLLICFVFGFGFWYLIFWFVTNESNLFLWGVWTKIFYLILSFSATSGGVKEILS